MFVHRLQRLLAVAAGIALVSCVSEGGDTIGPRGGEITSDDGRLTLVVHPDTFDEEVELSIVASDGCEAGSVACYDILPAGTMTMLPVSLEFDFGGLQMSADPSNLSMFFDMGGSWVECADHDFDGEDEVVMATLPYFSTLAIVMEP